MMSFVPISDLLRLLTDDQDVWSQNSWDHVPPPDDQREKIAQSLAKQRSNPVPSEDKTQYNERPAKHWYVDTSIVHLDQAVLNFEA